MVSMSELTLNMTFLKWSAPKGIFVYVFGHVVNQYWLFLSLDKGFRVI